MRAAAHGWWVLVVGLCAVAVAGAAHADADVAILPVRVSGYPRDQVEEQVRASVQRVLGVRAAHLSLVEGPAGGKPIPEDCAAAAECRASLIQDAYDELALVDVVRISDAKAQMRLQLFDVRGAPTFDATDEISVDDAERGARSLLTRAFAPAQHAGTLEVAAAPNEAEVLVDGLRMAAMREALSVGQHELVVKRKGAVVERTRVTISFDRTTRVELKADAERTRSAGASPWIATGVAAVSACLAVGLVAFAEGGTAAAKPADVPLSSGVARTAAVGAAGVAAVALVAATTLFWGE